MINTTDDRLDAVRERYQLENAELRAFIGRTRRLLRDASDQAPHGTSISAILNEALSLPIPGPWRPDRSHG